MQKVYFSFAVADSMVPDKCTIHRKPQTAQQVRDLIVRTPNLISVINSSHEATINALSERFNINVVIPKKPPSIQLNRGDLLLIASVRGLPRLTDRHEYTNEEINSAEFRFGLWVVG